MDIRPVVNIQPTELKKYISNFETNYKTPKDIFIGTFIGRTLKLNLSGIDIPVPDEISIEKGIGTQTPIKQPTFIIDKTNLDLTSNAIVIKGSDYSIKFDKYYDLELEYDFTNLELVQAICLEVGVELENINFTNANFVMTVAKVDSKYTYRNIIAMIAADAGGIAFINSNNKLEIKKVTDKGKVIENIFKQELLNGKIGPINSVVLAREPISDYIQRKDDTSIAAYGKTEIKITNNVIVDDNREGAIQGIYDNLHNVEFYCEKVKSYNGYEIDPFDLVTIDTKKVLITNINIKYPNMLDGEIGTEQLSKTEINYKIAKGLEKRVINAEAKVDKVTGQISLVSEEQTNQGSKIASIEENVDGITTTVQKNVTDIQGVQTNLTETIQDVDQIKEVVKIIGGANVIVNSMCLYGLDKHTSSGTGFTLVGKIDDLITKTKSSAMVKCVNKIIEHGTINTIAGLTYTITFKYSNDLGNNYKFVLTNTADIVLVNITELVNLEEVTYTFVASGQVKYRQECSYIDNTKGGFYTDLIIADGYLRKNWEPAQGEIMGTSLSIYYNGVEIKSENSSIKTIISNLGFTVTDINNVDNVILALNNLRVQLTNTEIKGTLKIEDFMFQQLEINSEDCLFLL